MTPLDELTIACCICGGPIFEPDLSRDRWYPQWLAEAILLHSEANSSEVALLPATIIAGSNFTVSSTGDRITACEPPRFSDLKPQPYLASHERCCSIAKEVVDFARKKDGYAKPAWRISMHHLWLVLLARYRK